MSSVGLEQQNALSSSELTPAPPEFPGPLWGTALRFLARGLRAVVCTFVVLALLRWKPEGPEVHRLLF